MSPTIFGTARPDNADIARMSAIVAQIWRRPESQAMFNDDLLLYQENPSVFAPFYALAADEGTPAGFIIMLTSVMSDEILTISWAAVDPARQRQGIGGALLGLCTAEAARRGKRLLIATSSPDFFARHGFRTIDQYFHEEERFLMVKEPA